MLSRLLRTLTRTGFRKGVMGGSRFWFTVTVIAGGLRLLQRIASHDDEVLFRQELAPGSTLVITNGTEREPEILTA